MRLRTLLVAVLAIVLFAAALLWMLPAEVALRGIGERLHPLRLEAVSGTVWSGRAGSASVLGERLGSLRWRLARLPLLRGVLDADFLLEGERVQGSGHILQHGETLVVERAALHLPAALIEPALDIPALRLLGTIEIDVAHAALRNGYPEELAAIAHWRDAAVAGAAAAELGQLSANVASRPGGGVAATVQDHGGPLSVQGTLQFDLTGYRAEARLQARDGNPQVTEALAHVGRLQPDGSVHFVVEGGLMAW